MASKKKKQKSDESNPNVGEGSLLKHVDELVETLRELTPAAIRDGDVTSIHHSRVATRRLKAAFDLLDPIAGDDANIKPFGRSLKKLRRRLGPLRDLDVMSEHVDELSAAAPTASTHVATLVWLRKQLKERRDTAASEIREDSPPSKVLTKLGAWWGLREDLADASAKSRQPLIDSLRSQLNEFTKSAEQLSAKPQAAEGEKPLDPHEIRIAGKALRYTLEMARAIGLPMNDHIFKSFKRMQDALGMWHDYVVLTETMLAISSDAMLAHHDAAAQRGVLALAQVTLKRAEAELAKFGKLWAKEGQPLIDATHVAIAVDPTIPTLPTADPDPTATGETLPTELPPQDVPPPT